MSVEPATLKPAKISAAWRKIFRTLPYDLYRDAGDCFFDEEVANKVIEFVQTRLRYWDGDLGGELIQLQDWQKAIFGAIFGWKRPDGTRRFRNVWFYIPRKNTKTMMLAIMVIIFLFLENEAGQQIRCAGANDEQTNVLFGMVRSMIEQDDELAAACGIFKGCITCDGHSFKMITAGNKGKHGKNINLAAIDEIHEHPNSELVTSIRTSKVARKQPLIIEATTADTERESYCNDRHEYAKAVRDGQFRVQDFLPIIFELTDPKRWKSEKAWREVNPNLGVSVKLAELREACELADQMPSMKYEFCRLHLNLKVKAANRWLDMADWDKCEGLKDGETPKEWRARMLEALRGQYCWGGLDLSSVEDLTCEALIFEGDAAGYEGKLIILPWVWCPEDSIMKRGKEFQDYYKLWRDDGYLIPTPGDVIDYEAVRGQIIANNDIYPLVDLAIDYGWQGADTTNILREHNGINVVPFSQSAGNYTQPMQDFEVKVRTGEIVHGGNPLLRWAFSNVIALRDQSGQKMRPAKENKNSPKKIDPAAATLMAHARWNAREKDNPVSVYDRGERMMFI